jgi:hypothetical protein
VALEDLVEIRPDIERRQSTAGAEILIPEDGMGAEIYLDGALPALDPGSDGEAFDYNLAKSMTKNQRNMLATKIVEFNTTDRESRKEWLETLKIGMELLGVAKLPDTKVPFEGASQVQHPLIAEAVVQYNAHAIEEFFPAEGPVKTKVMGKSSPERQSQSERVGDYMNYYLTAVDKGYYVDTDQMLFLQPIWGSIFRKGFIDPRTKQPRLRFVKCEDLVVPYDATSIEEAPRVGHEYSLNGGTIKRGIRNGIYADVDLPNAVPHTAEGIPSQKVTDIADQRVETRHEDDKNYHMLEYHIDLQLEAGIDAYDEDEFELPYIVLVDKDNLEVLSVRRNWKQADPLKLKRNWFKHYKFFPGVGFYGWGFIHAIGALAQATSGGIRALLDAASFANMQGGFKTKEAGKLGGEVRLKPGVWQPTEVSGDDINKLFFTPPFREPSPALAKITEILAGEGRRFTSVSEALIGNADNKAPVGTTIALIEQSMKLFTAIHKRMHVTARAEFEMLAEMFSEFAEIEEYPYRVDGEDKFIFQADFDDRVDVLPVSDPNIFSNLIRISLCQARLELMNTNPALYTKKQWAAAHKEMLQALRVPNIDDASPKATGPKYMDPVSENAMAMTGNGIQVFPGQLHEAHMAVHANWLQIITPRAEADPELQMVVQALMAHNRAHEALMYREQMEAQLGIPLPPLDVTGEDNLDLPPDIEAKLTMALAAKLLPVPPSPEDQQATQDVMDENARKDALASADIERKTAAAVAEQMRKDALHKADLRREEEAHAQNLRLAASETAADITRANAEAANSMRIDRTQALAENLRAADEHDSVREREEESHKRAESRADDSHTRNENRTDEQHQLNVEHSQTDHEKALEHAEQDHKRGIEFDAESHEQNLALAEQAAKAKPKPGDKK